MSIKGGGYMMSIKGDSTLAHLVVISSTAARLFPLSCSELQCQLKKTLPNDAPIALKPLSYRTTHSPQDTVI